MNVVTQCSLIATVDAIFVRLPQESGQLTCLFSRSSDVECHESRAPGDANHPWLPAVADDGLFSVMPDRQHFPGTSLDWQLHRA